ncbi:amino acid adenylation domain-containing protein [Nocardia vinacea]|uniref:polyketide synthase n=1 Tax=Nocardia vinacea TaxID=96468 RepID=UPI002E0D4875|nr:polyketide synthase [Nocardia vinacea]WSF94247.1 amino acid adenylation domain-containing protein [Nocardia vinacea]
MAVHHLIEHTVRAYPNAPAVEFGDRIMSYSQLNAYANRIARQLVAVGVKMGDAVGLCVDRSIDQIAAVVGIVKAGCAVVPLDPAYPRDRLAFMVSDSGVEVVITAGALPVEDLDPQLQEMTTVWLDEQAAAIASRADHDLPGTLPAEATCYMIYTSGSTGQPKGVVVEHAAVANLVAWHRNAWLSEVGTRTLLFSPISFDVAFHEIFAGLCTGATLVQVDEDTRRNPMALLEFARVRRIQKWYMPFVTLQQIAQAAHGAEAPGELAELIVGGEVLRVTPAIREFARRSGCVIHNHYGSTECIDVATYTLSGDPDLWPGVVPIGHPNVANMNLYLLDRSLRPVSQGEVGEIYAEGELLARCYHRRPGLTAARFVPNPFMIGGRRLYRMGDLGRYLPDGTIECLGRADNQVKIRGYRVEPSEVEAALAEHPAVAECVVTANTAGHDTRRLLAYVVAANGSDIAALPEVLRANTARTLPDYMVPAAVIVVDALPLTPSGKVDVRALAALATCVAPESAAEESITSVRDLVTRIWCELLEVTQIDVHKSYFDLGADSLMMVHAHQRIAAELGRDLPAETLFRYPTAQALASFLCGRADGEPTDRAPVTQYRAPGRDEGAVAIIGMACRVPGADTLDQFWSNLRNGVESITRLPDSQVFRLPTDQTRDPHFVPVAASIEGIEYFDAEFFGYSPAEAAVIDPQQRLFLECAWEALENAGADTRRLRAGVYAGSSMSTYLINNVLPAKLRSGIYLSHRHFDDATELRIEVGNSRDHLPMRTSFKCDLRGPSVNVQSTCSTSLVAVHMARQALLSGECEIAVAGGVSIITPQDTGYLWREGMMVSHDGHLRAFDAAADGTVFGNGLGVVVLKRLSAALAEGDHIYAVITGSAVNNDGSNKIDYSGPNVAAQAEVIARAHHDAGVNAEDISYVETHGTGTILGDPIEIAGLTEAFGHSTDRDGAWCAIGSVKTNIGHLDEAAGVIGLIKTALSLNHRQIPPSLGFTTANPRAALAASPFVVNTELRDWSSVDGRVRRAGVSSFGMGGTNCHVVLEEPPGQPVSPAPDIERPAHLLTISARTPDALRANIERYHDHLDQQPADRFADICFSAATGRRHFDHRIAVLATDAADARSQLTQLLSEPELGGTASTVGPQQPPVAFLCTGHGSQYPQMGRVLYETQLVYREAFDRCDAILAPLIGCSLSALLYGPDPADCIDDNPIAHPALFSVGYAIAALWESWGVRPDLVVGYSLGEYLAACLAGVFSLEDGLRLVASRARLVDELTPPGAMVYVPADADTVAAALIGFNEKVSIAVVNAPDGTVISGDRTVLDTVVAAFQRGGIEPIVLPVSRAFHSPAMVAVAEPYRAVAETVVYSPPRCNIIANLTGELAGAHELQSADYWVRHMIEPVQFTRVMAGADQLGIGAFVEIGPKATLSSLGRRCLPDSPALWLPSLAPRDPHAILAAFRALYLAGIPVDWNGFDNPFPRRRVPVPTYAFQRRRHWIDLQPAPHHPREREAPPRALAPASEPEDAMIPPILDLVWEPAPIPATAAGPVTGYVVIGPRGELTQRLTAGLRASGASCALVPVDLSADTDSSLSTQLGRLAQPVMSLRVLLVADPDGGEDPAAALLPVVTAARAVLEFATGSSAVSSLWFVTRERDIRSAGLAALARTITAEHPDLACTAITVPTQISGSDLEVITTRLRHGTDAGEQLALRAGTVHRARLIPRHDVGTEAAVPVRHDGTYVITGGTGGLGLHVAAALAQHRPQRLILVSRYGKPADTRAWQALSASGVTVEVVCAEVTDEARIREIFADCGPNLRGVIHCAGVVDDGIFVRQTAARIAGVLGPKVRGAWLLHTLTADRDLDFFVLFSSLASVIGYRGQASYAAANGFLDGLAAYRRQRGLPAVSVSWGSWAGAGMSAALTEAQRAALRADGETRLIPGAAVSALTRLLTSATPHAVVADMDWERFAVSRNYPTPTIEALMNPASTEPSPSVATGSLRTRLRNTAPQHARELLRREVSTAVAALLGCDPDHLDPRRGLEEMGLDSLGALDLRAKLETDLGVRLSATVAFDHPCVDALVEHLADRHFTDDITATPAPIPVTAEPVAAAGAGARPDRDAEAAQGETGVAIIGMACKFPGADSPDELWKLLLEGQDMVAEIPPGRWDVDGFYDPSPQAPGKMHVRDAATITGLDFFDTGFFGISPREAASMDPRHRLLLASAWHAVENAGIDPTSLHGSDTAVYLGCDEFLNDYLRQADAGLGSEPYLATGTTLSMTAGRLSYKFGCHGPSLVIATGCSSALVAVHSAVQAIRSGDCELAIVGSGKLMVDPLETVQLCKLGALASDGRSKVFSAAADGFGRGEGVATIVLKRLDHALTDGDPIHAVIRGSAVNHDGPSSGLTVPNGAAQTAVITRALRNAGITAAEVTYVETHGTGTQLGDPIELNALGAAFDGDRARALFVGSVKANIGHLEEAAGLAGLIKTVLMVHHGVIPAQLHCEHLNTNVDWAQLRLQVPGTATDWPTDAARIAGVSSFGLSGTNAHVIVESHTPATQPTPQGLFVFPFSARDEDDLRASIGRIADALSAGHDPGAIAYTLQVGRQHYRHRLAVVAASISEVRARLQAVLGNGATAASVHRGNAGTQPRHLDPQAAEHLYADRDLVGVAARWCEGFDIDWQRLYPAGLPRRVALPGYPFKHESIWSATPPALGASAQAAPKPVAPQLDTPATPTPSASTVRAEIHAGVAALLGFTPEALDSAASLEGLGADSLMFTRLGHFLRDHYQVEIPFQQLIDEAATVDDVVAVVTARQPHTTAPTPPSPAPAEPLAASTPMLRSGPASLAGGPPVAGLLTDQQTAFIGELVAAYAARTSGSKSRAAQDRPVMANCRMTPFQMSLKELCYPIVAERSYGSRFWDVDGNEYLDIAMGYGVHFFGYQPDFVLEALRAQLDEGVHIGPQVAGAGHVARQLCEITGNQRAVFCNSGTEAVMAALRFARAATGRTRFVMFEGSYHGWSDGTLALPAGTQKSMAMSRGVGAGVMSDVIVLDYGAPESLEVISGLGAELAAVLVEPVQSRRPDLQPAEFLHTLRELTHASGMALIFDEVVTGFRVGPRGAQGWSGVDADMAVYGKILGGGLPVGAVAGRAEFLDTIDGGAWSYGDDSSPSVPTTFYGGTFNRNPLTMAAASAVLTRVAAEGPQLAQRASEHVAWLAEDFNTFCRSEGFPLRIVYFTSVFRFIGEGDYRLLRSSLELELFFHLLALHGVYVLETRVCYLSAAHTDQDMRRIAETAKTCLHELRRGGFFPAPTLTTASVPIRQRSRLLDDAHLDLTVATGLAPDADRGEDVLVTGATGFLGRYLTRDLLEATSARIHCLVRARDTDQANQRVIAALTEAGEIDDAWRERIVAIPAELSSPRLGVATNQWRHLAEQITAIYHCGAHVNALLPYDKLEPANVCGTRELLRLAAEHHPTPFHYVSSDAVFDAHGYHRHAVLYEDQPLAYSDSMYGGGYAETKWVADTLVDHARSLGLPTNIYRPGVLLCATTGGCGQPGDFMNRFLRGVIELGVCPDLDATIDLTPVDYASHLIVDLSRTGRTHSTFHLTHPDPISYAEFIEAVRANGYRIQTVALHEWDAIVRALRHEDGNPLYPLVPLLTESPDPYFRKARLDVGNTRAAAPTVIDSCPSLPELIALHLQRLRAQGFLPPAPELAGTSAVAAR